MIRLKENKSWRTELPGIKLKILPSPIAGGCHMRQDHTGGKAGAFGRSNKRTVAIHRKNSIQSFSSLSWENKSFIHTRKKKRKQRQESNNRHRIHPAKKSRRRRRPARRSISTSPAHRPAPDTLPHGESRTPSPDVADPVCQPSREPNRRGLAGRGEYPGGGGGGADLGFAGRKKKKLFFSSQGGEYDAMQRIGRLDVATGFCDLLRATRASCTGARGAQNRCEWAELDPVTRSMSLVYATKLPSISQANPMFVGNHVCRQIRKLPREKKR